MSGPNVRIMNYVVMALGTTMWAAGTSGSQFMDDAPSFVFEVMKNDDLWKEKLSVYVKVDTAMVPVAAKNVLKELGAGTTDQPAATADNSQPAAVDEPQPAAAAADDSQPATETRPEAGRTSVVTVNALLVVAKVVLSYHQESEALEMAMSVIASSVKCNALQYVSVQLRAVDIMMSAADFDREVIAQRISDVWNTLLSYLDKLSQLKEPLGVESEMYREWETVAVNWSAPKAVAIAATELFQKIRKLMDDSLSATCQHSAYEQYEARLGLNPETENWDSPEGVAAIFNKCQDALDTMFGTIPISTIDLKLWNEFLDKSEKLNQVMHSQAAERIIPITVWTKITHTITYYITVL